MQDAFSRMELLVGNTGVKKLSRAKIAVFGLGGAGSQVAESLARCGVGSLTLIDHEKITLTNIGSQVLALHSTLGMSKVEAAKKRIRDIDENILVHTYETFYNEETAGMFELRSFDYIVDTMGTLSSKLLLISRAREERVPVISCLDIGGMSKVEAAKKRIRDIDENILVHTYETFYNEETAGMFELRSFDYIVDTMGTLSSKLLLISRAREERVPVISCLDIGDKIDPSRLEVADISRTTVCPAARIIKKELRKQGIRKLKVLYSREQPAKEKLFRRRRTMVKKPAEGNISFVTGTAGYLLAGEVVRDILSAGNVSHS